MTRAGRAAPAGALLLATLIAAGALAEDAPPPAAPAHPPPLAQEAPPPPAVRATGPETAAPPPPRPPEEAPVARPETAAAPGAVPAGLPVPEPAGYRGEPYRAPVPATLAGATVLGDDAARALWLSGRVTFLDLLPTPVRPANLPAGTLWRDPPRDTIPGARWLANTGYDALDPATEAYFRTALATLSGGDKAAPLVFFCKQDCWMSWNGAKRALADGYARVFWYPGGTDGWAARGWPLEAATPYKAPGE